jgi:multiple sugar transport system substrate-binding protein
VAREFEQGGEAMRRYAIILGALITITSSGAQAADLVLWWEYGYSPEEDAAVRETIAAFEQKTGKQVEVIFYPDPEFPGKIAATLEAGAPTPDFAFGTGMSIYHSELAIEDRLVDLTDTVGHYADLFDPDALAWWTLLNRKTGQRALYGLPIGRASMHLHVWKSLLQQAGFKLEDIPKEWDAFWAFWCDDVQPAVRRATGHDDIWGIGLSMSADPTGDTPNQFQQFMLAYEADYVTRDGKLVIDDPQVRQRLIRAMDAYTSVYRKGCTPPDSVSWDATGNNKAFLARTVEVTVNQSLSIPNALKHKRPKDYYENTATIEWPLGPNGEAFPIGGTFFAAAVFKSGGHIDTAKDFVRFLVAEGWLAHYLDFAGERFIPPMPKLLDAPFWLDPSDRHHMSAVMQIASRPMRYDYATVRGDMRYDRVWSEAVWETAIHRVAAEGVSPEQAVDEAIARIKQILSE